MVKYKGIHQEEYRHNQHIWRWILIGGLVALVTLVYLFRPSHMNQRSQSKFISINWSGSDADPQQLVGAYFYEEGKTLIEDGKRYVKADHLPQKHRVFRPGFIGTTDYYSDRLNLFIDENNLIKKAKFG